MAGYRPVEGFNYDEIGKVYGPVLYYPLREIAAMFGTLTVPLVYATARQLDVSWAGSLVAAGLFCFDNLNVIESRLILMDSQIMLYLVLSLYCALHLWKTPARSARRLLWLTVTGIVCGFSISVKWTALATPAMIAIVSFFGVHFLADPLSVLECAWAGAAGIAFYVLFFYVHFQVSVRDGPGAPFFADELRRTLVGHAQYDPSAPRPSFLSLLWYTNRTMLSSNASIMTRHTWESYWYAIPSPRAGARPSLLSRRHFFSRRFEARPLPHILGPVPQVPVGGQLARAAVLQPQGGRDEPVGVRLPDVQPDRLLAVRRLCRGHDSGGALLLPVS